MTCQACQARASNPHSGRYQFKCLECCAALVRSARPDKRHAGSLLAAIALHRDAPSREEILERLK
jgi:hypothetical protein